LPPAKAPAKSNAAAAKPTPRCKRTESSLEVIFDILTRPAPELSADERSELKKVVRELLTRLKQLLVLNWRQKSAARAQLRLAIEDVLESGLPRPYDRTTFRSFLPASPSEARASLGEDL
jgi:hypothetical protein